MDAVVKPQSRPRLFLFYMVPNFSMMAFATAIEPLRIANRLLGRRAYDWRIASRDGKPVNASNGIAISVHSSLDDERDRLRLKDPPHFLLVCAGIGVEAFHDAEVNRWLHMSQRHGVPIGGLCTAAWVLADAGLLDGKRCAIHWENLPNFAEAFPEADVYADLFEVDGAVYTCAGGTAPLDMMLHLIGEDQDDALVTRLCEQCLTDRMRNPQDRQRLPLRARLGLQNAKLLDVIELMEANLSEPVGLLDIAARAGLSRRQIERLFHRNLGRSPARYYLELRLDRARHLLLQSQMPVVEVAVACGFVSASHFSKCYRELYGRAPQRERQAQLAEDDLQLA